MTFRRIPPFRYYFPENEIDWIQTEVGALLRNGDFLTMGNHVSEFERQFGKFTSTHHAVAVANCTSALEIILRFIGVEGKEVIVPTNTFAATAFAVQHAGGTPVLADCLPDLSVDPADVKARITSDTAAVITVHIGGYISPTIDSLLDICRANGIPLIEDAAHAHGTTFRSFAAGKFGLAAAYSFFSTKVMTTGEGGMIVTDDSELAEMARLVRDQAKESGRNVHHRLGYNWRMTEIQALMGLSQLRTMDEILDRRRQIAARYDLALDNGKMLERISWDPIVRANFYKYLVVGVSNTIELTKHVKEEFGVTLGGTVYDVPLHRQPAFARFAAGTYPVADRLCTSHISLPVYHTLEEEDVHHVVDSIHKILGRAES